MGSSRAIFTPIDHTIYGQNNTGEILVLSILPSASVGLAVMFIMRPTNVFADEEELKCFYSFLYTALALAGVFTIMISPFISLITIWDFLGRMLAGFRCEFLWQKYKFPRPLMFTTILLVMDHVGRVFIDVALTGLLYVAQWSKSLRSCLVNGFHFINRNWREGENKVLKHLPCRGYMYLKEVAKGRWPVVFICFLIIFPAEGAFTRGMYSETQSAQTISDKYDTNQYVPVVHSDHGASQTVVHLGHRDVPIFNADKNRVRGDGKHSTETTAATIEAGEVKNRKLLKSKEPRKAKPDVGQPAQHN